VREKKDERDGSGGDMNRTQQFIAIVVLGAIGWSVIFSIGTGEIIIYLPLGGAGASGAEWIGYVIGWVLVCFIPGVPLLVVLKQFHKRSEKFRKFVEKVK